MPNRAVRALHVQHDRCVNKNSMLLWHVSIDSVWLFQSAQQFQLMKEKVSSEIRKRQVRSTFHERRFYSYVWEMPEGVAYCITIPLLVPVGTKIRKQFEIQQNFCPNVE